jgi:hypothetical protein
MLVLFFVLFLGLEIKHYLADYFLQPYWMLAGKGDVRKAGGYLHAGVHVLLSAIVLLFAGTPWPWLLAFCLAEFVVHYLLDYWKIQYSRDAHVDTHPSQFWALHGLDQMLHQLTYAAMIYGVFVVKGAA